MQRLSRVSVQVTATCLAASLALIGPGVAGVGAPPLLALLLLVVAAGLFVGRDLADVVGGRLPPVVAVAVRVLWFGPVLGAAVVVVAGGASAGELQAYGGLFGLIGMVNYFLRPVYGLALAAVGYVRHRVDGTQRS